MNRQASQNLVRFFAETDYSGRMGHNCFWANASLLLRFHRLERYALPFLEIGPLYGGPRLDTRFLQRLESRKTAMAACLDRLFQWKLENVGSDNLLRVIRTIGQPFLLKVDPFVLHARYPLFPPDHDGHYLVICGSSGSSVRVLDQYFGFKGTLPYQLLEQAVYSPALNYCGEVLLLEQQGTFSMEQDEEWLSLLFCHKLEEYIRGRLFINGVEHLYGLKALIRLHNEWPEVADTFFREFPTRAEALGVLSRRVNIILSNEREGFAHYIGSHAPFLSQSDAAALAALLLHSARRMRQISYAIVKSQWKEETINSLLKRITRISKTLLSMEIDVHHAVDQWLYQYDWHRRKR
ncbi:MAG: hypothetical protein H0Z34_03645 [Brevibacillus sp.]|nr:hypothetical protein [Brevibacillus sp.]